MHILAIILLTIFAIMGVLASIFFIMCWFNSRLLKQLKEEGFFD